ncbi:MAG: orotidine 5'-phosphate decarboxylase / HUMPS family protein [Thermofilaceae archaeon]
MLGKLWGLAHEKGTRVIVALDTIPAEPYLIIEFIKEYAVGLKIGLPFLLRWGPEIIRNLCEKYGEALYMLCDMKLADIPYVVSEELILIKELGFDGAIVHVFQGGIQELSKLSNRPNLFGLIAMSHPQSTLIDAHLEDLLKAVIDAGAEGCVVPATKPDIIGRVRRLAPRLTLLAPGIGAQGPQPGSAIEAGADFEIIGRAVTLSEDPSRACKVARDEINAIIKKQTSKWDGCLNG